MVSFRAFFAFFTLSVPLLAACGDSKAPAQLGESCATTDDCGSALACAESRCSSVCVTTVDCTSLGGGLCVLKPSGVRVCEAPTETSCARNADCSGNQICGNDRKCRAACAEDADCLQGEKCTAGACGAPGVGGGNDADPAKTACIHHSDCPSDWKCVAQVCAKD